MKKNNISKDQIVIYRARDRHIRLEVKLEKDTVWLNQAQIANLFDKDVRTISEHINNAYKEGELARMATIRKFRIVQKEGKREVVRSVGHKFKSVMGSLYQTFDRKELYPSVEEKAAHLLYFTIKDHPFADGNKRVGSLLFVYFLERNSYLLKRSGEKKINDNALVAVSLLIAASQPKEKDTMVKLITNLLKEK